MCASMEGNALFALLKLGLADERIDMLVERLLAWQWPDGAGTATRSQKPMFPHSPNHSFPCRGLALDSQVTGHVQYKSQAGKLSKSFSNHTCSNVKAMER